MKNSRTSTNKNIKKSNNVKRNSSTVPSSTTSKNVKKDNIQNNNLRKQNNINSKNIKNKNIKNNNNNLKKKNAVNNSNIKKNSTNIKNNNSKRNSEINIRLNKSPNLENNYLNEEYDIYEIENVRAERVSPKSQKKNEKTSNKELKKERKFKASTILKIFLFIGICVIFVYLMFNLETLNLSNIKVEGNVKYTDENIIKNLNLEMGKNVFKQLYNEENNKISLAYISELKYGYEFPSTIIVTVKERYPQYIALDKNTKKYYKIDNEGYLLEECDLTQKEEELLIEGFVFEENPKLGEKINDTYISKLDIYNNIKQQLQNNEIQGNITKVNFSNSLTIITLDDKLNVVFENDSNLAYKVSFFKSIIIQNGGMLEGTIDMSVDNPVYSKYD